MNTSNAELRKLFKFIMRNHGIVTARAVTKGVAHCRGAGVAQGALEALVEMNIGKWENKQSGRKGGRPSRVFVLTDAQATFSVAPLYPALRWRR